MEHSLVYQQAKDTIKQSLGKTSYLLTSLIELFKNIDDHYNVLASEITTMDDRPDLRISAAELKDAFVLVEELLADYAQLIAGLAVDEVTNTTQSLYATDEIVNAKDLAPEIDNMIYELSAQVADFNELFVSYQYHGLGSIDTTSIRKYMEAGKKVSMISSMVATSVCRKYDKLKDKVNGGVHNSNEYGLIMEAVETVKAKCFVSLIPEVSLIEVGKTEKEVRNKTKEYFEGDDVDSEYVVYPCSQEVYNAFTIHGEVPEEWETIDGVVVLMSEYELYNSIDSERLNETKHGTVKAAIQRVKHEVDEKLKANLNASFYNLKLDIVSESEVDLHIQPDTFINKTKFDASDKGLVKVITKTLGQHDWFENVEMNEKSNGTLVISMEFGDVDISNSSLKLNETALQKNIPKELIEAEELTERNADGMFKATSLVIGTELEDILHDHLTVKSFRVGKFRERNLLVIDIQPDKIFGDGTLPDEDKKFVSALGAKIEQHPWVDECEVEFASTGEALYHIKLHQWTEIDFKKGFKLR